MLVTRSVIWHVHKKETSVFIIKNVMHIGMAVNEIHTKMTDTLHQSQVPVATNEQELISVNHPIDDESGKASGSKEDEL